MRETRVLSGFTRVNGDFASAPGGNGSSGGPGNPRGHLWRERPTRNADQWLPAYRVYGEGIFLRFAESAIQEWEQRDNVRARAEYLVASHNKALVARDRDPIEAEAVPGRLMMLHTLSHMLIQQLTFDCGYGTAALRERLYVSARPGNQMAGMLLYTADGDSEGTMGGLVRMGNTEPLQKLMQSALERAEWCSSDPVCMEAGDKGGQGPDSCNLAACHACALLPETSCEHFNRYLDRGLVIGVPGIDGVGFLEHLVRQA
jgi:hypothetical protein